MPNGGTYTSVPIDLTCLAIAAQRSGTTVAITLTATVHDFQGGNAVAGAQVKAFAAIDRAHPFATTVTDGAGHATLAVPIGQQRIGFETTATSTVDTLVLDQTLAPASAAQAITIFSVSSPTSETLPALIGETRTPGSGSRSACCATASRTTSRTSSRPSARCPRCTRTSSAPIRSISATPPIFRSSTPASGELARRHLHGDPGAGDHHRLCASLGYPTTNDLATGTLRLVAELAVPLPTDSALKVDLDPRATH